MTLILSLFPGIGLLDMAFEHHGFCVVRGPDALWGGDIKTFHPPTGKFEGVIGGPPCQAFSQLRHIVLHNGGKLADNLIPEFQRVVVEAGPEWFLMENVKDAPEPNIPGYAVDTILLNNRWVGGEQNRLRRLSFGVRGDTPVGLTRFIEFPVFENPDWGPAVCANGGTAPGMGRGKQYLKNRGRKSKAILNESIRLQGLPEGFLDNSPFTLEGKHKVIGNGVPLPLGKAVAKAIKQAIYGGV